MPKTDKNEVRLRVHKRIRRRVAGDAERPRLAVYRSLAHIYAQVIDDRAGTTIVAASSNDKSASIDGGNVAGAKALGKTIAERLIAKGIKRVVFDRGGFLYHGRIRAIAEAAREAGLEF